MSSDRSLRRKRNAAGATGLKAQNQMEQQSEVCIVVRESSWVGLDLHAPRITYCHNWIAEVPLLQRCRIAPKNNLCAR